MSVQKESTTANFSILLKASVALLAAACFFLIAYFVKSGSSVLFDDSICRTVYSLRNDVFTKLFSVVTFLGNWQTISLLCVVALFFKQTRKPYGYSLTFVAIASVVTHKILKEIFARTRPDEAVRLIHATGFSFPSGHATTAIIFYGLMIYFVNANAHDKRAARMFTALLSVLIAAIGFSRIYFGVHYPTDIAGGFCVGTAVLSLFLIREDRRRASVKENTLGA